MPLEATVQGAPAEIGDGIPSGSHSMLSSRNSSVFWRNATTMASSAGVSTVLFGAFGPIGASAVVVGGADSRSGLGFITKRTVRERALSFDAWSSALSYGGNWVTV